jgi:hypothetical protein
MGIDLEFADVAAARYQLDDCAKSDRPCAHEPACLDNLHRLLNGGPTEFPRRRFGAINETMRQTGMGYAAEAQGWTAFVEDPEDREATYLRCRSQTVPGKTGIPAFKLMTNDRWLITVREIDEALAAYANVPADERAALEEDSGWVDWLAWLDECRRHGGFEAE